VSVRNRVGTFDITPLMKRLEAFATGGTVNGKTWLLIKCNPPPRGKRKARKVSNTGPAEAATAPNGGRARAASRWGEPRHNVQNLGRDYEHGEVWRDALGAEAEQPSAMDDLAPTDPALMDEEAFLAQFRQ
jgi:hypothetical protein